MSDLYKNPKYLKQTLREALLDMGIRQHSSHGSKSSLEILRDSRVIEAVLLLLERLEGGHNSAVRIERGIVLIDFMRITASSIPLWDFHQSVGRRTAILIQHAPADDDAFSEWLSFVLSGEIVRRLRDKLRTK